jgi:hypothetical protein
MFSVTLPPWKNHNWAHTALIVSSTHRVSVPPAGGLAPSVLMKSLPVYSLHHYSVAAAILQYQTSDGRSVLTWLTIELVQTSTDLDSEHLFITRTLTKRSGMLTRLGTGWPWNQLSILGRRRCLLFLILSELILELNTVYLFNIVLQICGTNTWVTYSAPYRGRDSPVGIVTGYGLDGGIGVRVPEGTRIFSSPQRPDRF